MVNFRRAATDDVRAHADAAGLTIFDDLDSGGINIYIVESETSRWGGGIDKTGARLGIIEWDPDEAALIATSRTGTRDLKYQSPALGLIHEMGHASQWANNISKGKGYEEQVIFGIEKQWANHYREPIRDPLRAHGGRGVENKPLFWFTRN